MARAVESGPSVRGRAAAELGSCCAEVLKCPTVAMNVAGHLEWVSECWGGHAQDADCCLGGEESLVDALLRPDPAAAPLGLMYDKGVGRVKEAASGKGATLVCKLPPPPPPPRTDTHKLHTPQPCGSCNVSVVDSVLDVAGILHAGPHIKAGGELSAWELLESARVARARVFVEHLVQRVNSLTMHVYRWPGLLSPSLGGPVSVFCP